MFIQPFNPARAEGESFEAYKQRRASQDRACKMAVKSAGQAWDSLRQGTCTQPFKTSRSKVSLKRLLGGKKALAMHRQASLSAE